MRLLVSVILLCGWTAAYAQSVPGLPAEQVSASTDTLFIASGLDQFAPNSHGTNGSLDWARANENGRIVTLGAAAFQVPDGTWLFARGGVSFHPSEKAVADAKASIGGGRISGKAIRYQIYEGGVSYKLTSRFYPTIHSQYLDIGEVRGSLIKPGVVFVPVPRFSADLVYSHSITGKIDLELFSTRFDFSAKPVSFLWGFAIGHAPAEIVNLKVDRKPVSENLKEVFAAFRIPLRRGELTVVSDFPNLETTRKQTLTLSWKLPLGKRSAEPR